VNFLARVGRFFRPDRPDPETIRHDVTESSERMTSVETSLEALRVRLDVMTSTHRTTKAEP
jgi:hypothetical protein